MKKEILVEDAVLRDTFWNAAIDLKKENDVLKQRIKRLVEAGQIVEDAAHSVQDWSGTALGDALDELNKAKEANP